MVVNARIRLRLPRLVRTFAAALGLLAVASCEDAAPALPFNNPDLWVNRNPDFAIKCPGVFPQWDKTCSSPADCTVVKHQRDCCGNTVVTAVASSVADKYQSFEDVCRGMLKNLGCTCDGGAPVLVDDSGTPLGASGMVQVQCELRTCRTKVL